MYRDIGKENGNGYLGLRGIQGYIGVCEGMSVQVLGKYLIVAYVE